MGVAAVFADARVAFELGRTLDAWTRLRSEAWAEEELDAAQALVHVRCLDAVGSGRLALAAARRAVRRFPGHAPLRGKLASLVGEIHGPFAGVNLAWEAGMLEESDPARDAELRLASAFWIGLYREFALAHRWIDLAAPHLVQPGMVHVYRAAILNQEDKPAAALAEIERGLAVHPTQHSSVSYRALLLQCLEREDEAEVFLRDVLFARGIQSAAAARHLAAICIERGDVETAERALAAAEQFEPLRPAVARVWFDLRLALLAARRGDAATAGNHIRAIAGREGAWLNARLARNSGETGHSLLPVRFVRQHHVTCAPATWAAISSHLGKPVDHLDLADDVTYGGTSPTAARAWLEQRGWTVREFRVTWDAARALLERGLPFAIVTTGVRNSHLQAVIGHDSRLGLFLLRDPMQPHVAVVTCDDLLERQAPYGPRGTVILPEGQADRIAGIDLPEAELYDRSHRFSLALDRNDREAAGTELAGLERIASGHRLTLDCAWRLAWHDGEPGRALGCVRRLRALFPDCPNLELDELAALAQLGHEAEYTERLRKGARVRDADPALWRENEAMAHVLGPRAAQFALRMVRRLPCDAGMLQRLASQAWIAGRVREASWLYRLAAGCAGVREDAWMVWFRAARHCGETDDALAVLGERCARLRAKAAGPSTTLASALVTLNRPADAEAVLRAACEARPADGTLRAALAGLLRGMGRLDEAGTVLDAARPLCAPAVWLREAAALAEARGARDRALGHWRGLLEAAPTDLELCKRVVELVAGQEGFGAALEWLDTHVRAHREALPLRRLQMEWLRHGSSHRALARVDELLQEQPDDAWAHRERALILLDVNRAEEALASALRAEQLEPAHPGSPGIVAQCLTNLGRAGEAIPRYKNALAISIDAGWAQAGMLAACRDTAQRTEALRWIASRLGSSQDGAGCLQFVELSIGLLPGDEVERILRGLLADRSDRPGVLHACCDALLRAQRPRDALELARQFVATFPFLVAAWLCQARACRSLGDRSGEIESLRRAFEIEAAPEQGIRLAGLLEVTGDADAARRVLETGCARAAFPAPFVAELALLHLRGGDVAVAESAARRALLQVPWLKAGWEALDASLVRRDATASARRETFAGIVALSPNDERVALQHAQWLRAVNWRDAALAEVRRALDLRPGSQPAREMLVEMLAECGRFEEARASCTEAAASGERAAIWRHQAAWVFWMKGDREAARDELGGVLRDFPEYVNGWRQLADWHGALGDHVLGFEVLKRLIALVPSDLDARLRYADGLVVRKEDVAAAEAFRAVLVEAPGHLGALGGLTGCLGRLGRADEARRVVADAPGLLPHQRAALQVELALAAKEPEGVVQNLVEALRSPDADRYVEYCLSLVLTQCSAKVRASISEKLRHHAGDPGITRLAGAAYVQLRPVRWALPRLWRLRRAGLEFRRGALLNTTTALGEQKSIVRLLALLAWERRTLRGDDACWGEMGYALAVQQRLLGGVARRWLADWRTRPGASAWMLNNLAHVHLAYHDHRGAEEAVAAALQFPHDALREGLLLLGATLALHRGDLERAAALLAERGQQDGQGWKHELRGALEMAVRTLQLPRAQRPWSALWDIIRIQKQFAGKNPVDPSIAALFHMVRLAVARGFGVPWRAVRSMFEIYPVGRFIYWGFAGLLGLLALLLWPLALLVLGFWTVNRLSVIYGK